MTNQTRELTEATPHMHERMDGWTELRWHTRTLARTLARVRARKVHGRQNKRPGTRTDEHMRGRTHGGD